MKHPKELPINPKETEIQALIEAARHLQALLEINSDSPIVEAQCNELLRRVITNHYPQSNTDRTVKKELFKTSSIHRRSRISFHAGDIFPKENAIFLSMNNELLQKLEDNQPNNFVMGKKFTLAEVVKYSLEEGFKMMLRDISGGAHEDQDDNRHSMGSYFDFIMTSSLPLLLKFFALSYLFQGGFVTDLEKLNSLFRLLDIHPEKNTSVKLVAYHIKITGKNTFIFEEYREYHSFQDENDILHSSTKQNEPTFFRIAYAEFKAISPHAIQIVAAQARTYKTEYVPQSLIDPLYQKTRKLFQYNQISPDLKEILQSGAFENIYRLISNEKFFKEGFAETPFILRQAYEQIIKNLIQTYKQDPDIILPEKQIAAYKAISSILKTWFAERKEIASLLVNFLKYDNFYCANAAEALGNLGYYSKNIIERLIKIAFQNPTLVDEGHAWWRKGTIPDTLAKDDFQSYRQAVAAANALTQLLSEKEIKKLVSSTLIKSNTITKILNFFPVQKDTPVENINSTTSDNKKDLKKINLDDVANFFSCDDYYTPEKYQQISAQIMQMCSDLPSSIGSCINILKNLLNTKKDFTTSHYCNIINILNSIANRFQNIFSAEIITVMLQEIQLDDNKQYFRRMHIMPLLIKLIPFISIDMRKTVINIMKKIIQSGQNQHCAPTILAKLFDLNFLEKNIATVIYIQNPTLRHPWTFFEDLHKENLINQNQPFSSTPIQADERCYAPT